ncbi:hypothetical protein ACNA06_04980 [Lysinibacillus sp. RSDA_15]|uniref:hypothetical protein n=1 Tax=Lysinibacillus TaxID=400634 RepID=UPI0018CDB795|nr:hypothetical protein [Lysinibacillus sphaericus]MBG9756800.1 hypothetical protein [Lysinibacillus sphaericus]QTB12178.1 hypothetical protein J2B92_14880 [Lysinibacillus sphaericus]
MELAGAVVNVRGIEDIVGRNTKTPSPKPPNTQPSQNGSNKKPAEDKGTGKGVTFKKGHDTHLIEVESLQNQTLEYKVVTDLRTLRSLF